MNPQPYRKLLITLVISFVIMYGVMFLNVAEEDHIYLSLTRTYMSLLMVTPMAVLMLVMMRKMYPDRGKNMLVLVISVAVFTLSLWMLRSQALISDRQYMRAMIPHHSSAILTSKAADLRDPEVRKLAEGIIQSQEREIREMKSILARMER